MLSIRRPVLFLALFAFLFGLVPAGAQITPTPLILTVSVYGVGPTLADAERVALTKLREDYLVLSHSTSDGLCHKDEILGITLCSIKVTARVIRKSPFFP